MHGTHRSVVVQMVKTPAAKAVCTSPLDSDTFRVFVVKIIISVNFAIKWYF